MIEPFIIGISGGTASGKTTLAKKIQNKFKNDCIILSHDFYYRSYDNITMEERLKGNYDCPEAYETELLISDIKKLKKGNIIKRPIYSYTTRLREKETIIVKPTQVIIIEGILVLENKELINLMDMRIFVDTDSDIRLARLIKRDTKERDIDVEYIISKYISTLKPMHEKYIEPSKKNADIIVLGNKENNLMEETILAKIREVIKINDH